MFVGTVVRGELMLGSGALASRGPIAGGDELAGTSPRGLLDFGRLSDRPERMFWSFSTGSDVFRCLRLAFSFLPSRKDALCSRRFTYWDVMTLLRDLPECSSTLGSSMKA